MAQATARVRALGRKTQTGNMQHASCPCVLRGNNGKKVSKKAKARRLLPQGQVALHEMAKCIRVWRTREVPQSWRKELG